MTEPDYQSLYKTSLEHNAHLAAEIKRLTKLLEEMQANFQSALDGNTELRQQMNLLQENQEKQFHRFA